jgi:hypothetical protein
MQGATPAEVRRAGGRYDFNGFWGQPPASVTRGLKARQAPSKPEVEAPSDAKPVVNPPAERLAEVTRLHDAGLLTDDEYQAKRAKIIDEL